MENKAQPTEAPKLPREVREPGDPKRQMHASQASPGENRVSEPDVETDGQMIEAGYGHGV
jgi:hypothetical protein